MNECNTHTAFDDIINYKEDNGVVYGYLNQKALDLCLYNRAKERTHDFKDKNEWENERDKRPVWLEDIEKRKHSILFRPVANGDYVSKGSLVLDIGLDSLEFSNYCTANHISQYETWLYCGIRVYSAYDGLYTNNVNDHIVFGCNLGNTIKDGDLLFTITLAKKPIKSRSLVKTLKLDYSLMTKEFLDSLPYLNHYGHKWLVPNYSYVDEGDVILAFTEKNGTNCTVKSPYSGLIVQDYKSCRFYPNETFLINDYPYSFNVIHDDFTKSSVVNCQMTRFSGLSSLGFNLGSISANFVNLGGLYYLLLSFNKKELKLNKHCALHLLLNNGNVVTLTPTANPVGETCKFSLASCDLGNLESSQFIKWKITNAEGVTIKTGNNVCCLDRNDPTDITQNLSYIVFQRFIKDFRKKVEESVSIEELESLNAKEPENNELCYVYLMEDSKNGFYKIGISNNPKYREHTLQSDKPTIELVCAKTFPNRTIAKAIEGALHQVYAAKRIRGEWFNLDLNDIEVIKQTLTK